MRLREGAGRDRPAVAPRARSGYPTSPDGSTDSAQREIATMSAGSDLIAQIASRQNLADYQKKHWTGTFAEYLDIVRTGPEGHPHRLPAGLRHDPQLRHRGDRRQQGEAAPLQVLRGPDRRTARTRSSASSGP